MIGGASPYAGCTYGGAGSGGSIRIEGNNVSLNNVSAAGGAGWVFYGVTYSAGGQGRTAVYYENSFSGNFTPGYLQKLDTPDTIFNDGFENGDFSAWTASVTDGGDLSASESADYWGRYGLSAVLNDINDLYLEDESPISEHRYRARFYLDPNGLTMASGDTFRLLSGYNGSTLIFYIQIQKVSGIFQVRLATVDDVGTWYYTNWYNIQDAWTAIEMDWQSLAYDGTLSLYINGSLMQTLVRIDSDTRNLTKVRLGAEGVDAGTSGTFYIDDFESRRFSYIGLLPDPGVDDPDPGTPGQEWFPAEYSYDGTQPHAVSSVTRDSGTDTYIYDENGNMTCRVENGEWFEQKYNAENRISAINKRDGDCTTGTLLESWSYAYDGDGIRVTTLYDDGSTQSLTRYYFGGAYETHSDGTIRKYYAFAGQTIAMRAYDSGTSSWSLNYFLTDHLGSTLAVLDDQGAVLSETRYMPFGAVRDDVGTIAQTDFGYTFQRNLPDTGLMDYKARFYDPYLNRFLQPDSIIPDLYNPQALNRYGYVGNNPINFSDPTGHMETGECGYGGQDCGGNKGVTIFDKPDETGYSPKPKPRKKGGDDGDASNIWELMKLGKDNAAHGNIVGKGLQSLKDDPSVQDAQKRIIDKIAAYPEYGEQRFVIQNSPSEIFTANGPSRKWIIAALTGNQAFYMVHTATLQATNIRVSADGYISTTWKVDDDFDYIPDWDGKGWEYNHFAEFVHFFYNDMWGAKETFPTNAYWNDTIPPVER